MTHDAKVVCPGPKFPVSRHELSEVLLAVSKKVLDPYGGLGQSHQRVDDCFAEGTMLSGNIRNVMKNNLKDKTDRHVTI